MLRYTLLALAFAGACASNQPARPTVLAPVAEVNARMAPTEAPVDSGDCAEALRRATAKPDLAVDRIPSPVVAKPAALQRVPRSALRKDGSAEIKVDVLIDTLGKPDMKTFTVVATSHPWLASNVKSVIAKWKFAPAELAGCKIPRGYHFIASAPARSTASR
jgi:hypothetical protein